MRRRRARSVDAVTMEGTMVAEADGDLPLHEEERGGEPQQERGQRQVVDVNPFWSSRAVEAARLRAMRPDGLPKVPDTVSPQKVETEMDAWGGAGGAPEGDLPGQDGVGGHPDAAGSRTRTEEFWSEIRRDLTADLENAENAGMANGDEHGLQEEGRRPGNGQEQGGDGALLHGNGREPPHHGDLGPGEGQGPPGKGIGRPGMMRGRPVEREAELRGPGWAEGGVGRQDPRALRQGGKGDLRHGGRGPYAGEDQPEDLMEDQSLRDQRLWEAACKRTGNRGVLPGQSSQAAMGASKNLTRLDLDWLWNDEYKVWVPERAQRDDDDELIGDMDLAEEMEKNFMKACRKIRGMEQQRKYLFDTIKDLRAKERKWQLEAEFWKARCDEKEAERFVTPAEKMEVFETPMESHHLMIVPPEVPPPPPPPPREGTPRRRSRSPPRSPLRGAKRTPGGTALPEGDPPRGEREDDRGWQIQWSEPWDDHWGETGWESHPYSQSWEAWKSWNVWENQEDVKAVVEQVESGGAGGKVELTELIYDHSPLTLGDWLAQVGPQMSDLSQGAAEWWTGTMGQAKQLYEVWLKSTPLERLKITVDIPERLKTPRFVRTEQRGVTLLLKAVPEEIRKELISAREITSTGVLYRLLVTYQPGGPGERALILKKLTDLGNLRNYTEAASSLREWRRYYLRAQEIGATLPDPTLLAVALERVVQLVNKGGTQAFRVAQARSQLGLDTAPTSLGIWSYSELLLAEMDTAKLMTSEGVVAKVKAMSGGNEHAGSHQHGAGSAKKEVNNCRYFISENGCRAGRSCKWPHDWEGVTDKAARCWTCGAKTHRKADCTVKPGNLYGGSRPTPKPAAKVAKCELGGSSGGGEGTGGGGTGGEKSQFQGGGEASSMVEKEATSATAATTGGGTMAGGAGSGTGELLAEATSLLRSLRLPSMNAVIVMNQMSKESLGMGLLDGGATHALRPGKNQAEWNQAEIVEVHLADGSSTRMRSKPGTLTLLAEKGTQVIVPMGAMTEVGYIVTWANGVCKVTYKGKPVEVTMIAGCPMVEEGVALEMIEQMEQKKAELNWKLAMLKGQVEPTKSLIYEEAMLKALKEFFVDVPDRLLAKLVVTQEYDVMKLPWNRRRRRTIERAERIHLHLFSGTEKKWADMEKSETVMICLDKANNPGQDLLNDDVYSYLIALAKSGAVVSVIGGPPCRTVSACRSRSPGPRPVRSEEHPYGFADLTHSEREMVEGDSVLWLRMMMLYIVAEETARRRKLPAVAYVQEQPRDPGDYRVDIPKEKLVSVWRFRAWKAFAKRYEMEMIHFDQGPLGHERRKPTTIATNLEQMRGLGEVTGPGQGGEAWSENLQERITQTKRWSAWAPGLVQVFKEALQNHEKEGLGVVRALRPLSAAVMEQWKRHFACDHQPARRDCRVCVESQGRGRAHRRVQHPQAYTLAVDLSGKLAAGKDQRCQAKYFVAAVYTYPVNGEGRSLLAEPQEEAEPEAGDVEEVEVDMLEEKEEGEQMPEEEVRNEIQAGDIWEKKVEEMQDVGVTNLTFVEPITSRQASDVIPAIARIYARLREMGLPVYRLHTDRARELMGVQLKRWAQDRNIVKTTVPGDAFKENGRVEAEIGVLKRATRTLLKASGEPATLWPMALRHAGERRLRRQLHAVGLPVKEMLPWGTIAYVKKKSWNERGQDWRFDRERVKIMGPDAVMSTTSGGYWVRSCEDGRHFATTDAIREPEEVTIDPGEEVVLEERVGADLLMPRAERPRRRLREKTAMSTMIVEGEKVEDQAHFEKRHQHVTQWVKEELEILDAEGEDQEMWLGVLREGLQRRNHIEAALNRMQVEGAAKAEEEWLVTKTVSMGEVRSELEEWKVAAKKEYTALVEESKAVKPIRKRDIDQIKGPVEVLPAKAVCTRKAPDGRRKVRGVVCGNYSAGKDAEKLYAGGADGLQIRMVLRTAGQRGWSLLCTDIRTAFLNAPRRDDGRTIVMEVPSVFKELGIAQRDEMWVVDKAVYGLTTSPRDWSVHRDIEIRKMEWEGDGKRMKFLETEEPNLWRIIEVETGVVRGLMSIYVDDVMLAGEDEIIEAAKARMEDGDWKLSPAEWATAEVPMRFCGFEVYKKDDGYLVNQKAFAEDLVAKWDIKEGMEALSYKLPDEDSKDGTPDEIREAQAITGALLWLASKTRPDIAVAVAAMSRWTRKGVEVVNLGKDVLRYVKATTDRGLNYGPVGGWASREGLGMKRRVNMVEVFADISYASGGEDKSVQGIVGFVEGAPICWESVRQPFVAQSTAEGELIGYCEALTVGRALVSLTEVVTGEKVEYKRMYGDNMAAISLASNGAGNWRTRHLRIRASALRWALEEGEWVLEHMPGVQLVADGFTKLLLGQAFGSFLVELGMVKQGHWASKKSHWAAEGHKKKIKIARGDEPATVGRPDGEEARKKGLRRLGREDEPPTKKSRADEPDSTPEDGRRTAAVLDKNHCPSGCPPNLGETKARIMMAIGASLVARAEGARAEAEISGVEMIDVIIVIGGILMAIGAAVVAKWTAKAASNVMKKLWVGSGVGRDNSVVKPARKEVDEVDEQRSRSWSQRKGLERRKPTSMKLIVDDVEVEVKRQEHGSGGGHGAAGSGEEARKEPGGSGEEARKEPGGKEEVEEEGGSASSSGALHRPPFKKCNTSWNQFQHDHAGRGWSMDFMRKKYYEYKKGK